MSSWIQGCLASLTHYSWRRKWQPPLALLPEGSHGQRSLVGDGPPGRKQLNTSELLLLLPSRFSRVRLCVTPQTAAHQAPPSLGFSRQEHLSGLPLPSPMHESEEWKWSRSVVSDSSRPHGPQPTRLLHPWDCPGKSTGVGCHRLLRFPVWPPPNSCLGSPASSASSPPLGYMPDTSSRVSVIEQCDCSYLCDLACLPSNMQCCCRGHHLKGKADHVRWHLAALVEQWFRAPSGKFSLLKKNFFYHQKHFVLGYTQLTILW